MKEINKQQTNGTPMSKELAHMLLQMKTEKREDVDGSISSSQVSQVKTITIVIKIISTNS